MVIYGGEVEGEMDAIDSSLREILSSMLVDVPLSLCHHTSHSCTHTLTHSLTNFPVVSQSIDFVDEHFKFDVLIDLIGSCHCLVEPHQCISIVVLQDTPQHVLKLSDYCIIPVHQSQI